MVRGAPSIVSRLAGLRSRTCQTSGGTRTGTTAPSTNTASQQENIGLQMTGNCRVVSNPAKADLRRPQFEVAVDDIVRVGVSTAA